MAAAASIPACALSTAADGLVAIGLRLLQRLLAGEFLRRQRLLSIEFQLHALGGGLRRNHLRLRLVDAGVLRHDLPADTVDGRLLGGDLFPRRVGGELVVAVVDGGDHVAGTDGRIVLDRDAGDIAGDLRRQRRVVGAHIGVVGRDHVTAADPPFDAKGAAGDNGDGGRGGNQRALIETKAKPVRRGFCAAGRRILRPAVAGLDTAFKHAAFKDGWEASFRLLVLFAKHCGAPHGLSDYARPGRILTEPFGQLI